LIIGIVQFAPVWEDLKGSAVKIDKILNGIADDIQVLIFPEMTLTGFTMNSQKFAEEIDGFSTTYFIKKSRELKKHIFAGIIEKDDDKIYNSLVHFDDSGLIISRYRKIHPFSMAGENANYSAGNEIVVTKIGKTKIGLTICYDLRFPELYRLYGKENCDIIINIANWPVQRIQHWKVLLQAHSITNQCFLIGVNRIGTDTGNKYSGQSRIYNPMGKEILNAEDKEDLFLFDLNLTEVNETRNKFPFLKDIKLI